MEAPSGDELNEKLLVGRGQARVENLTSPLPLLQRGVLTDRQPGAGTAGCS